MESINVWSIIVASIVAFAIGSIWYSPLLFGKEWMTLTNLTEKDIVGAKTRGMTRSYIVQLIFTLITFCVLGFAVSILDAHSASSGASLGFLAWLGFVLPTHISPLLWERKPFKLILIHTIGILLNLIVGGAIIGSW